MCLFACQVTSVWCRTKKKIVILAFFEDAAFICSDPCKYPLLLNNYIDRTSLTEIKYNFKIRLLLGKIKNFV